MRTIWKYDIKVIDKEIIISLPEDTNILHVGCQYKNYVTFWAEVAPGRSMTSREFRIFGTGQPLPQSNIAGEEWVHQGTVQDGEFVWHLYEKI